MSNVLTQEAKKQLAKSVRARYLTVGALVLTLGALIASLSLVPTFISITSAEDALTVPSDEASAALDDQQKALRAQNLVKALTPLLATSTPSDVISGALALRPAGISITQITYQAGQKTIALSGTSARREAVNGFRDALEASGLFKSVAVPVSALVGTQDGRFTITLTRF